MTHKITIIGIGDDGFEGLTQQARSALRSTRTVFGPQGLLDRLSEDDSVTHDGSPTMLALEANLDQVADHISEFLNHPESGQAVLLASGDPLFYGIARFLCDRLGEEHFEVLPHVSSMQLAFARVKESWDEAYLTNVATQELQRIVEKVRSAEKVGVFTSSEVPPSVLAKALLEQGIDYFNAYVCENLGSKDERVTRGSLSQIANQQFGDLNVMILVRLPDVPDRPASLKGKRIFGNPDEFFLQSQPKRGLLTPCEVRVLALAEMDLGPNSIAWDVGAGSGSVAIEAAQLSPGGQVYGIEMDAEDYNLLIENAQKFGTHNLTPVLGEAPQAWTELPDPDAIFIGGTGRGVLQLTDLAWQRLKQEGRFVVQLGSIDTLTKVESALRELGAEPQVLMINLARGQQQLDALRFESANPSFLVVAKKSS
ncbi:MAG: precorrin-6y C5,15-methyltransferase (decarboxylating) subunit CbiE [Aureliella sp.]